MDRQAVLARLQESEPVLRARGARHAALFGSRARADGRPDSDIDILVEFDPSAQVTVFDYAGLKAYLATLFEAPVDVVNIAALKPHLNATASRDAIYAF